MTPKRWKQIDELAQSVLKRGVSEREAFLYEACAGDDDLRHEVESLIAYQQQASRFLEEPAFKHAAELIAEGQTEAESMEGRTISHYSILSRLGAGGMGEVYLARDVTLGRKVAIKFLSQNSIAGEQSRKRFVREAKAAASLDHPHICAVYEVGEEAGHSFIVMQYVEGETLASLIQRQPFELRGALDIAVQIADALAEAHSQGITHRDIKPQNVMLAASAQAKVLDFGLARVAAPYYFKRDYVQAVELLRQANELGPAFSTTWEIGVYIQNRLFDEALAELEKAKRERKSDPILIYGTGMVYAAQGQRVEALQIIKELEAMSGASSSQAHWIAKIYAILNERELALTWLERGLAAGAIGNFYKDEPVWDPIRSEPHFADLTRRMGCSAVSDTELPR